MSQIIVNPYNTKEAKFKPISRNNYICEDLSFKEYRCTNDAVMVPDKGFTKQLKLLNPAYEVVWDWGSSKWEIWKFPTDGDTPHHVITVETAGKSYRELGADVLLKLQEGMWLRDNFTVDQLAAYFEEMENQRVRRQEKEFSNKLRAIGLDTYNYARGVLQVQVPRKQLIASAVAGW